MIPQPDDPPCRRDQCDSDLHCDRCGGVHHVVARMHEDTKARLTTAEEVA